MIEPAQAVAEMYERSNRVNESYQPLQAEPLAINILEFPNGPKKRSTERAKHLKSGN